MTLVLIIVIYQALDLVELKRQQRDYEHNAETMPAVVGILGRHAVTVSIDLLLHHTLLVVANTVAMCVVFFVPSILKMVSTVFALEFLEKIDDQVKATLVHLVTPDTQPQTPTKRGPQFKTCEFLRRRRRLVFDWLDMVLFMCGCAFVGLLGVTNGCKPGSDNGLEVF